MVGLEQYEIEGNLVSGVVSQLDMMEAIATFKRRDYIFICISLIGYNEVSCDGDDMWMASLRFVEEICLHIKPKYCMCIALTHTDVMEKRIADGEEIVHPFITRRVFHIESVKEMIEAELNRRCIEPLKVFYIDGVHELVFPYVKDAIILNSLVQGM